MWRLVATGVAVHLVMLFSVFDIFFKSPLEHDMQHHHAEAMPSKRVVLLVADGLRAESLYGSQMVTQAPYLRYVQQKVGSWGIAHTQVPTESRPGHIAMLAGFNEDPSAIFKGWKSNLVDFDSVINQSANAWCWGSPDIINIFKTDKPSHVTLDSYDSNMQDFSGQKSPAVLDTWVFNKVQKYFETLQEGSCEHACMQGNLFFLHLLGLDTAGHSFKPGSKQHIQNIKVVDDGVRLVETLFNNYFKDKQTTYIFTSDHGMTNWGSHGAGSRHETEVPFIAWGAAILTNPAQQDIQQIDIAPFISTLLGRNIPINSFGVLPLDYIHASMELKSSMIYANARQLAEQYLKKLHKIEASSVWHRIRYFTKLSETLLSEQLEGINTFINLGFYETSIIHSYNVINLVKEGVHFYNSYYQQVLLSTVVLGFIGWIVYLFISIDKLGTPTYRFCLRRSNNPDRAFDWQYLPHVLYTTLFAIGALLYVEEASIQYFYVMFPILTWFAVLRNYKRGLVMLAVLKTYKRMDLGDRLLMLGSAIELLLLSFFNRIYLGFLFVCSGYMIVKDRKNYREDILFGTGHVLLALGPFLLTLQTKFNILLHIGAFLCWVWYIKCLFRNGYNSEDKKVIRFQLCLLGVAFFNCLMLNYDLGLLWFHQVVSWILTIIALLFPIFNSFIEIEMRVLSVLIALMTPYCLMAVGFENLYMFIFAQHMLNWLAFEIKRCPYANIQVNMHRFLPFTDEESVRRCIYLLSYIMISYFGVGNTGSVNSFDPMWVRGFVTIFSPFTMMSLIILKLLIPFLMIMCTFRILMKQTYGQVRNNFLIILLFCDFILVQLLFMITNQGSWLEIGLSLSRFIVVSVTSIALALLYQVSYFLVEWEAYRVRYYFTGLMQFNR